MIFPLASMALEISKAAIIDAMAIQTEDTAMLRPGHCLEYHKRASLKAELHGKTETPYLLPNPNAA